MLLLRLFIGTALLLSQDVFGRQAQPGAIWFEQNIGQTTEEVAFLARTRQATVFVTETATVYSVRGAGTKMAAVRLVFAGGVGGAWTAEERQSGSVDSFVGAPARWRTGIPAYGRLRKRNVYAGVDVVYYGQQRELEYDFILQRGDAARQIRLRFEGARGSRINGMGDLEIDTAAGTLIHRRPVVVQGAASVEACYRRTGRDEYGISLGAHHPALPLTIDPVVTFTRFYGGEGDDVITAMSGAAIAGYTNSIDFPGTTVAASGGYDAFFSTLGAEQRIVYVGGSGDDKAWAVFSGPGTGTQVPYAIAGETNSTDFPVVFGPARSLANGVEPGVGGRPFQAKYGGGKSDGFLFWVGTLGGSWPVHSTYVGGSGEDRVLGIAGGDRNVTAVGETDSTDFPVSPDAQQTRNRGGRDGFVLSIDHSGIAGMSALSTYYGGSGDDRLTRINANLLASGTTRSDDLPLRNPTQAARGGGQDAFLLQIVPGVISNPPLFATYFGGSGDDEITALRSAGRWVAVGTTTSRDFPGGDPAQFHGGPEGFLCEFEFPSSTSQGGVIKTTFVGGAGDDSLRDAAASGDLLLFTGTTNSGDVAVREPLQEKFGGGASDALVGIFTRDGEIPFLSYFGGGGRDEASGAGVDAQSRWLVAGNTDSATLGASSAHAGGIDGFVMQFTPPLVRVAASYAVKNGSTFGTLLAQTLPAGTVLVRIRSADPSRLLLAISDSGYGQESIAFDWDGRANAFQLWGLDDTGTVDLIITAPGVGERTVPILLVPPVVRVNISGFGAGGADGTYSINSGATGRQFTVTWTVGADLPGVAFPPEVIYPRSGLPPQTLELVSSDPQVVRFTGAKYVLWPGANRPFVSQNAIIGAAGVAQLTARVGGPSGAMESRGVQITHGAPQIRVALQGIATGIYKSGFVGVGNVPLPAELTVTSLDPDVARVAAGTSDVAGPSVRLQLTGAGGAGGVFYVMGMLAGGTARLRFSGAGLPDVIEEYPVQRGVWGASLLGAASMEVSESYRLSIVAGSYDQSGAAPVSVSPAAVPLTFRVVSSDASVVDVSPATVVLLPGQTEAAVIVKALKPGTATVEVTTGDDLGAIPGRSALPLVVETPLDRSRLSIRPLRVGKNLQAELSFFQPPGLTGPATLTSSDPDKLLVSASDSTPGGAAATGTRFWVQALTGEGAIPITISAGGATATGTVELVGSYTAVTPGPAFSTNGFTPVDFTVQTFPAIPGDFAAFHGPTAFTTQLNNQLRGRLGQAVRAGLGPVTYRAELANSALGSVQRTAQGFRFEPAAIGEAEIVVTVEGPIALDPRSRVLRITVVPVTAIFFWEHASEGRTVSDVYLTEWRYDHRGGAVYDYQQRSGPVAALRRCGAGGPRIDSNARTVICAGVRRCRCCQCHIETSLSDKCDGKFLPDAIGSGASVDCQLRRIDGSGKLGADGAVCGCRRRDGSIGVEFRCDGWERVFAVLRCSTERSFVDGTFGRGTGRGIGTVGGRVHGGGV